MSCSLREKGPLQSGFWKEQPCLALNKMFWRRWSWVGTWACGSGGCRWMVLSCQLCEAYGAPGAVAHLDLARPCPWLQRHGH